ncbi:MAG: c-type cytochrome [Candidatus Methylomirabilales bacterium]
MSILVFLTAWLTVSFGPEDTREHIALAAAPSPNIKNIARGGLLYDKWWKVVPGATKPNGDHPLWSLQTNNKRKGASTWRCKECHGWDYKGKDGAYGTGSHRTGFPGVWDAAQKKSVKQLAAILRGSTNKKHDFSSVMGDQDIADLANFLKDGLIDMTQYVDYKSKKTIGGDASRGKTLARLCVVCHGPDGKKLNFGSEKKPQYVGTLANKNPQEFLHKVRMGHPGSDPPMPSALVLGWNIKQVIDVLAHAQTLPKK